MMKQPRSGPRARRFIFVIPAFACAFAISAFAQLDNTSAIQPTGESQAASQEAQAMADFKARLSDDGVVESLARRIAHSSFGAQISQAPDEQGRAAAIADWIRANPDQAAGLAVGLGRDDASGTHAFENALSGEISQGKFVFNPASKNGIYGRLRKTSGDSKLLQVAADENGMHAEEQSEIMRSLFEGQSGASTKIITQDKNQPPQGSSAGGSSGAGVFGSGYYDRLGRGNLHGYSPQLQALQSALNLRRPPGAPKLIETGRLDYATLSFPGYALRYDVGNLEERLRVDRNFTLAKALGLTEGLTREKLLDPAFEAELLAKAQAGKTALDPRFARRFAALEKAAAATRAFDQAALAAHAPSGITRRLLVTLGQRQKEAARWITEASLEEDLQRLDSLDGFLSPSLQGLIARCPVADGDRGEYRRRGGEYEDRLKKLRADDESSAAALESDGWQEQAASVQQTMDADAALRKTLERDIDDYVKVPSLFARTVPDQPRWRQMIDDLVLSYLPSTAYGRQLAQAQQERARLRDVFLKIAMGDRDAAHTILAAGDPR